MGKAIGIGGIFLKFKDPEAMKNWYKTALGLNPNEYGVLFSFNGNAHPSGSMQLGTFPDTTNYFGNPEQQVMLNFRVEGIESLLVHLQTMGTVICDNIETYDFGKFVHILDPEGNRIELWEPVDSGFDPKTMQEMR
jgi:predicted enzyme related to lactoylglutathione lyase